MKKDFKITIEIINIHLNKLTVMGFWIVIGYLILLGTITHGINQLVALNKENNLLLKEINRKMHDKTDNEPAA